MTTILGISALYHDSAAALVVDGDIVAAAQEERFTREKYDARFPIAAAAFCLEQGGVKAGDLDYIAFYEKPVTRFERLLETYLAYAPDGFASFEAAIPVWLKEKLYTRRLIARSLGTLGRARLVFPTHHESHAASAFFPSPFEEAAILTLDAVGEWSSTTLGSGRGNRIDLTQELRFPHSLGLLYSAFTYYCGFSVNSGEYKLMGLAPYGRPAYKDLILERLMDLKADGSFRMNMEYFNYCQGLTMTGEPFHALFGGPPRKPDSLLEQRHMDLASSIQAVTEEVVLRMGRDVHRRTGLSHLVMAGGVALNCVANSRLLREGPFDRVWIQPAAGDAGGALGAALFVWHQLLEKPRHVNGEDSQKGSLLGPAYASPAIRRTLDDQHAVYHEITDESALLKQVTGLLAGGKVVGWFHGRAEFGPRALGARSIIGDPRSPAMQATMNVKVKFRESFRPFAPCVLREHAHEWFAVRPGEDSPYMLMVAPVLERHRTPLSDAERETMRTAPDLSDRVGISRSSLPAITHVDYSARMQTVDERHGRFHRLLQAFHHETGCPVLVNTSFNLSWEPIVLTPEEAYRTFMQSELDALVLEDFVLLKAEQQLGVRPLSAALASPQVPNAIPGEDSPWIDPRTGDPLAIAGKCARNAVTGFCYQVLDGIPRLFVPSDANDDSDVTEMVKAFYEKTPFPNYDNLDNRRALLEKARAGVFGRLLNEQIPYDARVVEIGCGTGQLTNFLSIAHRSVIGIDVCLNSLMLAERFRSEQGLTRASFAQMNLFRPALKDGFFDVVISNGVLHHTGDCRAAFGRISKLVRPGGFLVVGLYNAYSRRLHYARRSLYRMTGITGGWLDPHFNKVSASGKREAWFQDQYCHPHETVHTIDETLGWIREDGFAFVNSIPKPQGGVELAADEKFFEPRSAGTATSRVLSQLASMGSGYREGGFFVVVARREKAV